MVEKQAMDRVYRMGQKRNVIVIRYIVRDSIEEVSHERSELFAVQRYLNSNHSLQYVQKIQRNKLDLIKRVLDGETITQKEVDKECVDISEPTHHITYR